MTEVRTVISSVSSFHLRQINMLVLPISLADLHWQQLAGALAAAEDALARLDERLNKSPIREGWIARTHFSDACAALWLEGELVPIEDLVLHDAGRDVRVPTHELTRAHKILRTRRRMAARPGWALSPGGFRALTTREPESPEERGDAKDGREGEGVAQAEREIDPHGEPSDIGHSELDQALAAVDALLAPGRAGDAGRAGAPRFAPTPDSAEDEPLARWRKIVDDTSLPPTLAAAVALQAWEAIEPARHRHLGPLLSAALLHARGKTRAHLACLHVGLRAIPREKRRSANEATRVMAGLGAIAAAAQAGLKDHDRWLAARTIMERKLAGRRTTSKLPALVDLILATPLASAGLIAERLEITPRAAQDLVVDLGLREVTGRGRYRAWAVL